MTEKKQADDLRMPADEFDRIMRGAFRARPPTDSKPARKSKPKKRTARQPRERKTPK